MSTWIDTDYIAFDTETTGVNPLLDRIVSAAAVRFRGGKVVQTQTWLLKIDVPIPPSATAIHGISDEQIQALGQDERQGLDEIGHALLEGGLPVVCFKADFDIAILQANLTRAGLPEAQLLISLCAHVIDRQMDKYVSGKNQRRLKPTAARYGIAMSESDWHGAEADALITGKLFAAQLAKYPEIARMSPEALSRMIPRWRAEQEAEFQAWRARQS